MKTHVQMMDKHGNSCTVFRCESEGIAKAIRDRMNSLNVEAARLTGQSVKFIYSILKGKA